MYVFIFTSVVVPVASVETHIMCV